MSVDETWRAGPWDLLVALHALKSAQAVQRCAEERPAARRVVALSGTDVYPLEPAAEALATLERADRIVALQPLAAERLPPHLRGRVRTIHQSARRAPRARAGEGRGEAFDVCVLAHLREVKDPLLAAKAARLLPPPSRVRVIHMGAAFDPALERAAREEMRSNPRYAWLGGMPHGRALEALASCRLLLVTSRSEGGANVVAEALAAGVPVLATRVAGNVGVLGQDYPGYFESGDAPALAALLARCEREPAFLSALERACAARASRASPRAEERAWEELLAELD